MKEKLIGILICMLLIGTVLPVSGNVLLERTSISTSLGDTLYVGGSGPGNYTSIQEAIDDSEDGDTVFVYDDSSPYYERVQINTSINLIGEDRNTTVIDANRSGNVIFISSDEVSIHEFTIQNSSGDGIEIDIYFGFFTISDNIIIDNKLGLFMRWSNNNTIEGNTFFDNKEDTILLLFDCHNNTISGNNIDHSIGTYHHAGIFLLTSIGNNISDNIIKNCNNGIVLHSSDNNLVSNNVISSGERDGIDIRDGSNNTIIGNNISYSQYWGIEIEGDSHDNIIYHNNLEYNYLNAMDEGNNTWDDGEYGNYWSDYEDKYPDAKKLRREGIWDTPYEIPSEPRGNNYDTCPLIKQWPDSVSKAVQNNENVWFHKWLERCPILQKILNVLDMFFDFYDNMKEGI